MEHRCNKVCCPFGSLGNNPSLKEIKEIYWAQAKSLHPDANPNLVGEERKRKEEAFKKLNNCYHYLQRQRRDENNPSETSNPFGKNQNPRIVIYRSPGVYFEE